MAPIEIASYNLSSTTRWLSVRLFHKIQKWAMQHADVTLRFNRMSCTMLDAFYEQPARKYMVNPIGVDLPSETASPGARKEVRLLSLGRLTSSKNTEFALTALAKLREYPWQFDMVGAGERIEHIRKFISANGLEDKVRCHGWQPESRPWFVNADLVLFTSRLDNCPLVVLESMSYGIPVLGIRPDGKDYISGIEELIEHGRTGLLASGEVDFNRQLEAVFQQPEQLAPLGQAARSQIAEKHTWERHLDRYEEVFDRLAPKERGSSVQMVQQSR
jgi:glycosyltransferase involved in cell wall biosynthesis